MRDNLILWELQKIHEALIKTKEEHTLNFRMTRATEKFNFSEPILNTSKLGLIRVSVYNPVFNVNRRNIRILYISTVIEDASPIREPASPIAEPLSTNTNTITNTNTNTNRERAKPPAMAEPLISNSNISSVLNYNYKGIPLLYSTITPGAYELTAIAELLKEKTDGIVIMETDKNTMKCKIEIKQGALSFDVENSIAPLLGFRKVVYKAGIHTSQ